MKKHIYIVLIVSFITLFSSLVIAEESVKNPLGNLNTNLEISNEILSTKNQIITANTVLEAKKNEIKILVNGMVCSFCAQGITKSFKKHKSIQHVQVSLEKKLVKLELKKNKKISDKTITKIINDSGYNVEKIIRS